MTLLSFEYQCAALVVRLCSVQPLSVIDHIFEMVFVLSVLLTVQCCFLLYIVEFFSTHGLISKLVRISFEVFKIFFRPFFRVTFSNK